MQADADPEPDKEQHLCISCLAPNEPGTHFCRKCGIPLDFYSATAPLESTLAQGAVLRNAVTGKPRVIVLVGVWLLFLPPIMGSLWGLYEMYSNQAPLEPFVWMFLFGALGVAFIYKVTRNYLQPPT